METSTGREHDGGGGPDAVAPNTGRSRRRLLLSLLAMVTLVWPCRGADEIKDARELFHNARASTSQRLGAAQTLLGTGKLTLRKGVVEMFLDENTKAALIEGLAPLVHQYLLDDDGQLLRSHAETVRKMFGSASHAKKSQGVRLAGILGLTSYENEIHDIALKQLEVFRRKEAGAPKKKEALDEAREALRAACATLVKLAPESATTLSLLGQMLERKDLELRTQAFEGYIELGVGAHYKVLLEGVLDPYPPISVVTSRALMDGGVAESIPPMIELLGDHRDAFRDNRVLPMLFRLTGQRRTGKRQWRSWWAQRPDDFAVLSREEFSDLKQNIVDAATRSKYGGPGSFFGLSPQKDSVVFVLDTSGSMQQSVVLPAPPGAYVFVPEKLRAKSRLDIVKAQVLNALDAPGERTFNIITFSSTVGLWNPRGSAGYESREQALIAARAFVERLTPAGSTNLYAALEVAVKQQNAAEVFLLSDGSPSVGVVNSDRIIKDYKRWNKRRRHKADIHCISMAGHMDLLVRLGETTKESTFREVQ